jgi:hypothetical protein
VEAADEGKRGSVSGDKGVREQTGGLSSGLQLFNFFAERKVFSRSPFHGLQSCALPQLQQLLLCTSSQQL